MTVMGRLVEKGLVSRTKDGKRYRYRMERRRQEFLRETFRSMFRTLIDDFGDLAIECFMEAGQYQHPRKKGEGDIKARL